MARELSDEARVALRGPLTMHTAGETVTERCLAPVRWLRRFNDDPQLQQLWEIVTERYGISTRREEWREVPFETD